MNDSTGTLRALGVPITDDGAPDDGGYDSAEGAPDTRRAGSTKADWVYDQSSGSLAEDPGCDVNADAAARRSGRGGASTEYPGNYAGHGAGLNNPDMDGVQYKGPLPRGGYSIGPIGSQAVGQVREDRTRRHLGDAMHLTPMPSNDMKGRSGFLMHGGNMSSQSSSQGCIVTPPLTRKRVGASGDSRLWAVLRVSPWSWPAVS